MRGQDALCGAEWCVVTRQEEHEQLRAAVLSEEDRLARFFSGRPGNPTAVAKLLEMSLK